MQNHIYGKLTFFGSDFLHSTWHSVWISFCLCLRRCGAGREKSSGGSIFLVGWSCAIRSIFISPSFVSNGEWIGSNCVQANAIYHIMLRELLVDEENYWIFFCGRNGFFFSLLSWCTLLCCTTATLCESIYSLSLFAWMRSRCDFCNIVENAIAHTLCWMLFAVLLFAHTMTANGVPEQNFVF